MNLQDDIMNAMSKQLAQDIDNELMADLMVAIGWTKLIDTYLSASEYKKRNTWIRDTCQGEVKSLGCYWLFKDDRDAVLFKLKWL